jgi:hypothetical protein
MILEVKAMTNEVAKRNWGKFFDELSRQRLGWETRVQVFKEDIGAQTLADGLALGGFMFEEKTNGAVEIMLGANAGSHQTHTIFSPQNIFFDARKDGGGIVEIEDADGAKTLVYFVAPAKVLIEYGESELVAQV